MTANINHMNGSIDERRMSHRAATYANLASQFDKDQMNAWKAEIYMFSVIAGPFRLISRLCVVILNKMSGN